MIILGVCVVPVFAVKANDIYQNDHTVLNPNVCGDQLCSNKTGIFGSGGPHFSFNTHASIPSNITSYSMKIILPDNRFAPINVILSNDNFTALKNNVATMAVVNITPSNSIPTSNYCPIARQILLGQDGYIGRIYNVTSGVDLTGLVYPSYCTNETGSNPFNPIKVPEFGDLAFMLMGVSVIIGLSISSLYNKFQNK